VEVLFPLLQIARILPHGGLGARFPEGRVPVWEWARAARH
jgi:hypothetical protein